MEKSEAVLGPVTRSLEQLADLVGDPSDLIYEALFSKEPRYRELFFLDPNGDVRGEMLSQAFDVLIKTEAKEPSAEVLVKANRFAHDGYGVSPEEFDQLFVIIRDVTRNAIGKAWTTETERHWEAILKTISN